MVIGDGVANRVAAIIALAFRPAESERRALPPIWLRHYFIRCWIFAHTPASN
jgi:hypothetical protein